MYALISDWLEVEYREITDEIKEYTDEEDYIQPGFEWDNEFRFLSDFVRAHNNPWGNIDAPDYIHGYDATNICRPLFIEINNSGDEVRLYEYIREVAV